MNFSIRNLLIVIAIFSLVMGLAYGIGGGIGYAGLVFLSVYVFPPFLWVAALNSAGLKRSFFVGVMVAGTVHFVVNIYLMWMLLVSAAREGVAAFLFFGDLADGNVAEGINIQMVAMLMSSFGGLVGMLSYWMVGQREFSE